MLKAEMYLYNQKERATNKRGIGLLSYIPCTFKQEECT